MSDFKGAFQVPLHPEDLVRLSFNVVTKILNNNNVGLSATDLQLTLGCVTSHPSDKSAIAQILQIGVAEGLLTEQNKLFQVNESLLKEFGDSKFEGGTFAYPFTCLYKLVRMLLMPKSHEEKKEINCIPKVPVKPVEPVMESSSIDMNFETTNQRIQGLEKQLESMQEMLNLSVATMGSIYDKVMSFENKVASSDINYDNNMLSSQYNAAYSSANDGRDMILSGPPLNNRGNVPDTNTSSHQSDPNRFANVSQEATSQDTRPATSTLVRRYLHDTKKKFGLTSSEVFDQIKEIYPKTTRNLLKSIERLIEKSVEDGFVTEVTIKGVKYYKEKRK